MELSLEENYLIKQRNQCHPVISALSNVIAFSCKTEFEFKTVTESDLALLTEIRKSNEEMKKIVSRRMGEKEKKKKIRFYKNGRKCRKYLCVYLRSKTS